MGRFLRGILTVLRFVFGAFRWTPPAWLWAIYRRWLVPLGNGWIRFTRGPNRVRNSIITSIVLLFVTGGVLAFLYWPTPEPETELILLTVSLNEPGLKKIGKEYPPTQLVVRFDGSAAPIEQVDKIVKDGLTLEPAIGGVWKWQGDNELSFQPEEDWPIKTEFSLVIEESFIHDGARLEEYEYTFTTPAFTARIKDAVFFQDEVNPDLKTVVTTLGFSHPVDVGKLEKHIHLSFGDPNKKDKFEVHGFAVTYDEHHAEAYVHSHSIPIPKRDSVMEVVVDEGITSKRVRPAGEN